MYVKKLRKRVFRTKMCSEGSLLMFNGWLKGLIVNSQIETNRRIRWTERIERKRGTINGCIERGF